VQDKEAGIEASKRRLVGRVGQRRPQLLKKNDKVRLDDAQMEQRCGFPMDGRPQLQMHGHQHSRVQQQQCWKRQQHLRERSI
jgi:hypothetical protein